MDKPISIKDVNGNVTVTIVEGTGNEVVVSVDDFAKQMQQKCGLRLLHKDIFKGSEKKTDESWLRGFSYSLKSIYNGLEYKRKELVNNIKTKLEDKNWLLLLGESGTSKTTLLMEILCDYLRESCKILYNLELGDGKIDNVEFVEDTINMLLNDGNKVVVVVDNVHRKDLSLIFSIIKKLYDDVNVDKQKKIRFILSARKAEFNWVLQRGIFPSEIVEIIELLFDEERKYALPRFVEGEIIGFMQHYKKHIHSSIRNKPIELTAREIRKDTGGHPIMVRFSVLQNGLENHVKKSYRDYLLENNKPSIDRIEFVLACSLYDISSIPFTYEVSNKLNLIPSLEIIDTLIKKNGKFLETIHPRWDLELLKYLFSLNEFDVEIIKTRFSLLINKILGIQSQSFYKLNMLNTIYNTIGSSPEKYVDIKIIEEIVNLDYLEEILGDKREISVLYASIIGPAYYKLNNIRISIDFYDKAINLNPENAMAYYNKGLALMIDGLNNEAIQCYNEAIRVYPDYAEAYNNKGNALSALGQNEAAILSFDQALLINPAYIDAYNNKGLAIEALGAAQDAIPWYNEAIRLDPEYVDAYNNKGLALTSLGQNEEAIQCYDEAIRLDPEYVDPLINKGTSLMILGRKEEAIPLYNEAIRLNPQISMAYYNRGNALMSVGRKVEAAQSYDKATKLKPGDLYAWYGKGNALSALGRNEEAIKAYDKVLELNNNNILGLLGKARSLIQLNRKTEAKPLIDKIRSIDPNNEFLSEVQKLL